MRFDRKKTIVLVAAALLAAVALASFAGCGGSSASSSNSKGQTSSGEVTEAQLGVPIYPGATKTDLANEMQRPNSVPGGTQSAPGSPPNGYPQGSAPGWGQRSSAPNWNGQGSSPRLRGETRTALWTKDSMDKVVAWYRDKLKGKSGFSETTRAAGPFGRNNGAGNGGTATVFSFQSGNTTKMVMIRKSTQDKGGTVITVNDAPQGMPSGQPTNQSTGQSGT